MDPFAALADETRRRLLVAIASAPRTAGALATTEPISRPAISRHLRVLREEGLVRVTTVGRTRIYSIDHDGLAPVQALLDSITSASAPPAPQPPIAVERLDALDLEIRRAVRDHRTSSPREETA
ncbi:MAG: winged helix-turn-helix transcriptional regulator [Microcella sp.]|uniref:ArsR/SmtB family transcription factor n=1 Tax=Microcella sp. TaxID=1913979 RepID=UPI0024C64CE8|nr:metalloregulator ArsR/SmtB family transcription factor [Microcella sp.]UYN83870.1 MAG: winged helix-turn-helix transcriptional regulator [Microcella sp.]